MSGSVYSPSALNSDPIGYAKSLYQILKNKTDDVDVSVMAQDFKNVSLIELLLALRRQSVCIIFFILIKHIDRHCNRGYIY